MSTLLIVLTLLFIVASVALVLIILVQRPQGGGLAGAFGGAGGGGTDTAFGGRTGDVLTVATIAAFVVYLLIGVALNIVDNVDMGGASADEAQAAAENDGQVVEQETPGEFLQPDTAPLVPVTKQETSQSPIKSIKITPSSKSSDTAPTTIEIKPSTPPASTKPDTSGGETPPGA